MGWIQCHRDWIHLKEYQPLVWTNYGSKNEGRISELMGLDITTAALLSTEPHCHEQGSPVLLQFFTLGNWLSNILRQGAKIKTLWVIQGVHMMMWQEQLAYFKLNVLQKEVKIPHSRSVMRALGTFQSWFYIPFLYFICQWSKSEGFFLSLNYEEILPCFCSRSFLFVLHIFWELVIQTMFEVRERSRVHNGILALSVMFSSLFLRVM